MGAENLAHRQGRLGVLSQDLPVELVTLSVRPSAGGKSLG